ncbi:MAG: hydantoinase B/oxoprolinase family protein [Rhizomicrobium sp.]
MSGVWNFYIDRGGTFTDVVAEAPDGRLASMKLLSFDPSYDDAALEAIRRCLGLPTNAPIPPGRVGDVRMGTTVATNALLERKGERVALVTTQGFRDQLRIGYQNRPKLFALNIELPEMLYERVIEAKERIGANGEVLTALDEDDLAAQMHELRALGICTIAIVFLHGYRFPAHEARAQQIARSLGFTQISVSHETVALMKYVSRGDTTVADAYLSPVLARYAERIGRALPGVRLSFMTSNGGLAAPDYFRGKDAILSGPAGGVVAMAETALEAGFERAIGFDMGGTSTDVSRFDGSYEREYETQVAGVRLRVPMLAIHTVAAGGGSILSYDGARFRAGPESAGADPGPACYRRGGPLCVTDANVMVGKLKGAYFPAIFGSGADLPLDEGVVHEKFAALAAQLGDGRSPEAVADGFIRIAVENMAAAIKRISVAKGYDTRDYALNCFGGAGGQHACLVADALGITTILIHPFSGVLSAYGMKRARLRSLRQSALGGVLTEVRVHEITAMAGAMREALSAEIREQGARQLRVTSKVHIRFSGSDTTLPVSLGSLRQMAEDFRSAHKRLYGFGFDGKELICETLEVEVQSDGPARGDVLVSLPQTDNTDAAARTPIFTQNAWHDADVHHTSALRPEARINGPALLIEPHQTIVVEPGWQARLTPASNLILERIEAPRRPHLASTEVDPVLLEVFANQFMAIAEQMGATLQNTASSVNIKERLDFSCAIFDGTGALVANAPHMPVHLGSMGDCVTAVLRKHPLMGDGDMFVTNAPYDGGTHLPDITVVAPVFIDGERAFFVAARGHHADIGGISPGSMPPFSQSIDEEGVLFDGELMIHQGRFEESRVRAILSTAPVAARNPDQNIADLKAQAASCTKGAQELTRLCSQYGLKAVRAYMGHVQDNAEESVRRVIGALKDGEFVMPMDDDLKIKVQIRVDRSKRAARIDFSGTSAQASNNLNAPRSVTKAAVLYVFRCLVAGDIPMNAGCLKPLEIHIPDGTLLSPRPPGAVAGGNVETSQAVVDTLFGALGVLAASQGTMNNLTFGNARYQYYETICGGAGAGREFDGQSAVHTHMTNSRLTDPEVLEARFPVVLEAFSIRAGSGGRGRHHGGDGVIRRIRVGEAMSAAILSTRRQTRPFGLEGGEAAQSGRTTILRHDGRTEVLKGRDSAELSPGDVIVIETPGGGGFGPPEG